MSFIIVRNNDVCELGNGDDIVIENSFETEEKAQEFLDNLLKPRLESRRLQPFKKGISDGYEIVSSDSIHE